VERHALFSLLLYPFASRTFEFFFQAKILNLFIGLAVVLSLSWTVARRYGRGPAVLAGLLYAASGTLMQTSANGNHDPLIGLQ
jgi:4-amino-4-deoxy-L-arabinose transferase-like glycosyltransferase